VFEELDSFFELNEMDRFLFFGIFPIFEENHSLLGLILLIFSRSNLEEQWFFKGFKPRNKKCISSRSLFFPRQKEFFFFSSMTLSTFPFQKSNFWLRLHWIKNFWWSSKSNHFLRLEKKSRKILNNRKKYGEGLIKWFDDNELLKFFLKISGKSLV